MLNKTDLYHASISKNLGFDVGNKFFFSNLFPLKRERTNERRLRNQKSRQHLQKSVGRIL
jgi:hypothetical protein